jgi:GT2 family glycosyltransferase
MYSEETDFCRRIKTAGWEIRHLPLMTILHHEGKAGIQPHIESLMAANRLLYARKHFSPAHRLAYAAAVLLRHGARVVYGGSGAQGRARRAASRQAIRTLLGRAPVPYAEQTSTCSVRPPSEEQVAEAAAWSS